jgi:hypothetical protein
MKKIIAVLVVIGFSFGVYVSGQSSLTVAPGATLSTCAAPVAGSKALIICNVAGDPSNPDGAYLSANGGAYFLIQPTGAGGVTSWKSRTGAVVPQNGDYSYSQLSSPPTKISCTTVSFSNSGFTGSGCTIN